MTNTCRVLIITTGGTIAGQVASGGQENKPEAQEGEELVLVPIGPTVDYLNRNLDLEIQIDVHDLCNVDSSNILPEHWTKLSGLIKEKYDEYESFIITHGTNTLGYTCAALSFALENPNKPIVLTGSQVPAHLPGSDAVSYTHLTLPTN